MNGNKHSMQYLKDIDYLFFVCPMYTFHVQDNNHLFFQMSSCHPNSISGFLTELCNKEWLIINKQIIDPEGCMEKACYWAFYSYSQLQFPPSSQSLFCREDLEECSFLHTFMIASLSSLSNFYKCSYYMGHY